MIPALEKVEHEASVRVLLCEMLRLFYDKGWVSGTGGGICATLRAGQLLVAPTGVHKERVMPEDFFVVDSQGSVVRPPAGPTLHPSDCTPVFCAVIRSGRAGSVVHSHALGAVLTADLTETGFLSISRLEMLKGIRGVSLTSDHLVPIIANQAREADLSDQVAAVLQDPRFVSAAAILVRDHGAYIWGADIWEAKRHAEVYHFLFDAVRARRT